MRLAFQRSKKHSQLVGEIKTRQHNNARNAGLSHKRVNNQLVEPSHRTARINMMAHVTRIVYVRIVRRLGIGKGMLSVLM